MQFIPRPTSTTLLDQMPLFYQRLEVLLKRIAITAGQAPLNSSMLEIRLERVRHFIQGLVTLLN